MGLEHGYMKVVIELEDVIIEYWNNGSVFLKWKDGESMQMSAHKFEEYLEDCVKKILNEEF